MFFFFVPQFLGKLPTPVEKFLSQDSLKWDDLELFLTACRNHRPDLTVGTLRVFIYVARRATNVSGEGPSIKDVAEGLGIEHGTARRHCEVLGGGPAGRNGLNWVVKLPGEDARSRHLMLSHFGVAFLTDTVETIVRKGESRLLT